MDVMSRHTPASRDFVAGRERSERREFTLRQLRDWAYSEWCEWNEQSERMENRANAVSKMNRGTKWTHYLNIINKTKIKLYYYFFMILLENQRLYLSWSINACEL